MPKPETPWVHPRDREPPPMDHQAGWKESAFTWEMGELVLARIAAGETVRQLTADPRMPSYATVYRWTHMIAEFGEAYRAVRLERCVEAQLMDALTPRAPSRRAWYAGPPSTYTPAKARTICAAIKKGASLSEVLRRPGMPSSKAIYVWMKRRPAFKARYVEACDWRDSWLQFQGELIAEDSTLQSFRIDRARVARLEEKRGRTRPKKYRVMVVLTPGPPRPPEGR
ncbi:MAG TPA: hypothetical protein VHV27_06070 [Phenylobacterium sp.]|nr:hypothetical protein [Phenylobacterium sp.]